MPDPRSRPRRPSSPPPRRGGGGRGPLPTVALAIGVIVAGLGIGALISAFQNRGTLPELGATSVPAVTPVPQSPPPLAVVTLAPTSAPAPPATAHRSASPRPSLTPKPVLPVASPSPTPSATPLASPVPSASVRPSPSPSPRPSPTPKPSPLPTPSALPTPRATLVPSARPVVAAPSPADADAAVVRRYIASLIAGDEAAAYGALGGTSGDRGLSLKEEAFLDKDARITSMHVSHADASGATVDAEIVSGRGGTYDATFHVVPGPNGPYIAQHDYIKL